MIVKTEADATQLKNAPGTLSSHEALSDQSSTDQMHTITLTLWLLVVNGSGVPAEWFDQATNRL